MALVRNDALNLASYLRDSCSRCNILDRSPLQENRDGRCLLLRVNFPCTLPYLLMRTLSTDPSRRSQQSLSNVCFHVCRKIFPAIRSVALSVCPTWLQELGRYVYNFWTSILTAVIPIMKPLTKTQSLK